MRKIYFCHGTPGSAADADLLARANPGVEIVALDLLQYPPELAHQALTDALISESDEPVHLAGFSIGAMAAIQIAVSHPDRIAQLTLISPAAPLQLGDFLPHMAGKPVFDLAIKKPKLLRALAVFQGVLSRVSPRLVLNMLFAKCGPMEQELLQDPDFMQAMGTALQESFINRREANLSYVQAYVRDWRDALPRVQCPVDLWHGSKDGWSPPQMSVALQERFGTSCTLHEVEDSEHYSTLRQVKL
ncbi:alpha/beta fold hydrolase [Halocynthiibacter styelae]|uniref:Alpha/beta hydrolase n=1 Tax=Halocynthiibacter styelae TaxID=2761955 RepID=A0A8J7LKB7_9RHOB|nr:alpha/beta hydrolase [Paenihalocynthiibacter styelae]MBI1493655.1 alpha/beta hydrolase [Paenihalocynthiibacter styelae]